VLPDGRTSFQALQNVASGARARASLIYFVFDLLRLDGRSLTARPLADRKAALQTLLGQSTGGRIRFSTHLEGSGRECLANACRLGLEGIVSKRHDRPYRPGRTSDWTKSKCTLRQEFVIGGFTDPEGMRAGLGALLVGYYDARRLVFSGKVGTGFTQQFATDLRRQLETLRQPECPFDPPPPRPIAKRAYWVKPSLVCEASFTEWTSDGMIRHPAFLGLRSDKRPHQVRAERPAR
jgi:bifunctional non-homologous end joining protein LigD